ncbi:MAG: hypothetical protein ABI743_04385 [bacterium]
MTSPSPAPSRGPWFVSLLSVIGVLLCGLIGWLWGRIPDFPKPALPVGWTPGCPMLEQSWRQLPTPSQSEPQLMGVLDDHPPIRLLGQTYDLFIPPSGESDGTVNSQLFALAEDGTVLARSTPLDKLVSSWTLAAGSFWVEAADPDESKPLVLIELDPDTLAERGRYPLPAAPANGKGGSRPLTIAGGLFTLPDDSLALLAKTALASDVFVLPDLCWLHFDPATHQFDDQKQLPVTLQGDMMNFFTTTFSELYQDSPTRLLFNPHTMAGAYIQRVVPSLDIATGAVAGLPANTPTSAEELYGQMLTMPQPVPPVALATPRPGYVALSPQAEGPLALETSIPAVLATDVELPDRSRQRALLKLRRLLWARQLDEEESMGELAARTAKFDALVARLDPGDPEAGTVLDPALTASVRAVALINNYGSEDEYAPVPATISGNVGWHSVPPPITQLAVNTGLTLFPRFDGDRALLIQALPVALPDLNAPHGLLRFGWVTPGSPTIDWWQAIALPEAVPLEALQFSVCREHRIWGILLSGAADPTRQWWIDFPVPSELHPTWSGYWLQSGYW